jgi:hypothetical protein
MKLIPKVPKTVADQIMLIAVLILFGCSSTMISLVLQEKPIPPEFKDFAERIALIVATGLGINELTK